MASLEETPFKYSRETGEVYAPLHSDVWIVLGCVECDSTHCLPEDAQTLVVIDE